MNYTFQFHPFKLTDNFEAREFNRHILAGQVKGVPCTYAGSFEDWELAEDMKEVVSHRLPIGGKFGTVESYKNGYSNIFVKKDGRSVGIVRLFMSEAI